MSLRSSSVPGPSSPRSTARLSGSRPRTRPGRIPAVALAAVLLLGPAPYLRALPGAGQPAADSSARTDLHTIAQRVDRHYNELHSLRTSFTESYEGMGMKRSESGTVLLLKPGRMRWDYTSPEGKIFLLDGKYGWFWSRGAAQIQRIPAKQLNDMRSPFRLLLGHTELEREFTNLRLEPAPGGHFNLTGQPRELEDRARRVTFNVTPEGAITAIEIEDTDGGLTRFTFTGEQPDVRVPDNAFRFTAPDGTPVVDALPPL